MQKVAKEAVCVENVEEVLPVLIKSAVGDQQIDIKIDVTPIKKCTARQAEVDAIIHSLMTAVGTAVIVEHGGHALVDIIGRKEEAVIVEPQVFCSSRKSPGIRFNPPLPSGPDARGSVPSMLIKSCRARHVPQ